MKILELLKGGLPEAGDLVLTDAEPSKDGRFLKCLTTSGAEHIISTKNLKTALDKGTAKADEAKGGVVIQAGAWNINNDSGMTLINYGGAGFNVKTVDF